MAGWPTTVSTYSNANCITPRGAAISTTYTGYDAFGNPVATVDGVATTPGNSSIYNTNGCTLTTNPYVMSHAWTTSESRYTSCVTYDAYNAQPTIPANAFGQSTTTTFDYTQEALPTLLVDANNQQTSASYSIDSNGNETVQAQLPLYTGSYTTQSKTNSGCTSTSALPCYEVDTISYQYNTVTARTFYDSQGRAVETRTPGPTNGYDTVVFTSYNDAQHSTFQSLPFVVADGSGWIDSNGAKDYNNNTPGGTGTYFDALGRVLAIKDPNFGQTQPPDQEPGLVCPAPLSATYTDCTNYSLGIVSGDSNTYSVVTAIDPNGHATVSYLDPLGRATYAQVESGKFGGTFTANELKTIAYNILNEPTSVVVTDKAIQSGQTVTSATTTASYDDLGRLTGINDPDRGNQSYSYDADGQMLTDVSGSRTIGYVYDLLGRVGCVQNMTPTESATGACTSGATQYIKNTYDTTTLGTQGTTDFPVGRLTKSVATTHYPDSSYAQVSELYQHDKRGRLIDEQISFPNLPGSWNVTTALPSYKMQSTYNDADQVTTTTTSTNPAGQDYTTTQIYDTTTGGLTGLSDTGSGPADLATLSFNAQAQVSSINYLTSTSSALAVDQFGYDANLRPITDTANWQSGSGNGTAALFSQSRSFDPGGNLTSLTTTQAAVPGATGSGGSETSNFCYDEQNRLVWAGNSGTQPGAGNGTCGSGTLSSSLSGASYSDSYVYTHLGQLYQGPLNGGSAQEQYLYCNTSTPHQLVGLYPTSSGATCSNYTGKSADYSSSYDAFGNVTSRSTSGTTGTLSYDLLDHLTKWFVSATNQEQYVYDASGNRILRRSTTSSSTTMTVYAFGLEEHVYSGSGTNQGNTYYYSLTGRLIGAKDANGTVFYMTDTLGSILASFTNAAGGATLKGNQVFGPYGNARYFQGNINTAKGFTGQYNDSLTGLDYYGARYYDPVAGVFLSADTVDGNGSGDNPYSYVGNNLETFSDPTGHSACSNPVDCGVQVLEKVTDATLKAVERNTEPLLSAVGQAAEDGGGDVFGPLGFLLGVVVGNAANPTQLASGDLTTPIPIPTSNNTLYLNNLNSSVSFTPHTAPPPTAPGGNGNGSKPPITIAPPAPCSFSFDTRVTTNHGKKEIGKLRVGDKVLAYNPKTHKMEQEPILHVWTHTDSDLVDVTISYSIPAQHGKGIIQKSEVLHTTSEYPFMTTEHGFVPAGNLKTGMHVLQADGSVGVITGWKIASGTQVMYNLEVAQDHTFTVGDGQWVVHNQCDPDRLRNNMSNSGTTFQTGQQAHHVIPCNIYRNGHDLLTQAGNLFDPDAAYNGRALYSKQFSFDAMNEGEPYHANAPKYDARVRGMMNAEFQRLQSNGLTTAPDAFDSLMGIIDQLNQSINDIGILSVIFQTPCGLY